MSESKDDAPNIALLLMAVGEFVEKEPFFLGEDQIGGCVYCVLDEETDEHADYCLWIRTKKLYEEVYKEIEEVYKEILEKVIEKIRALR